MPTIHGHERVDLDSTLHTLALWTRDTAAGDLLRPNRTQTITLIVAASYIAAIAILWCAD
jgi:hypothetical protein